MRKQLLARMFLLVSNISNKFYYWLWHYFMTCKIYKLETLSCFPTYFVQYLYDVQSCTYKILGRRWNVIPLRAVEMISSFHYWSQHHNLSPMPERRTAYQPVERIGWTLLTWLFLFCPSELTLFLQHNTNDKNTYKVYIITPHAHLKKKNKNKVQQYA